MWRGEAGGGRRRGGRPGWGGLRDAGGRGAAAAPKVPDGWDGGTQSPGTAGTGGHRAGGGGTGHRSSGVGENGHGTGRGHRAGGLGAPPPPGVPAAGRCRAPSRCLPGLRGCAPSSRGSPGRFLHPGSGGGPGGGAGGTGPGTGLCPCAPPWAKRWEPVGAGAAPGEQPPERVSSCSGMLGPGLGPGNGPVPPGSRLVRAGGALVPGQTRSARAHPGSGASRIGPVPAAQPRSWGTWKPPPSPLGVVERRRGWGARRGGAAPKPAARLGSGTPGLFRALPRA